MEPPQPSSPSSVCGASTSTRSNFIITLEGHTKLNHNMVVMRELSHNVDIRQVSPEPIVIESVANDEVIRNAKPRIFYFYFMLHRIGINEQFVNGYILCDVCLYREQE